MPPLVFHPRKRRGQSFLIDKNIINKIIKAVSLTNNDIVLEIGSGKGELTKELGARAKKVIGIELDRRLFAHLETLFRDFDNVILINKDILKFDIPAYIKMNKIKQKLTLVGNIPYNITTPILEYVFENIYLLNNVYLMVQKEFASRLIAKPHSKDYSSFTCFTQFHVSPKLLFSVNKACFKPQPKVDSCFIKLEPKADGFWNNELKPKDKKLLFKVVQTAFNQRRKTILNSLSAVLDKDKIALILQKLNIDKRKRAENLSLEDFIKISNLCFDYSGSSNIILER
ncbi:16S rRNA (adenine(1518)-N(6)/adenine(1519)-N(6))-dimethyltransferase RsmA [Candidatus Omnitrophota bacterium]